MVAERRARRVTRAGAEERDMMGNLLSALVLQRKTNLTVS